MRQGEGWRRKIGCNIKIKYFANLKKVDNNKYTFLNISRSSNIKEKIEFPINTPEFEKIEKAKNEPVSLYSEYSEEEIAQDWNKFWSRLQGKWDGVWVYKNKILFTDNPKDFATPEDILRIKHFVLKKEKELEKITKEVESFKNFDKAQDAKRERVPDGIRLFVWQRDGGRCVKCGNNEKLEFDHIIPVVEGGSNTERNIQLLCENCNRSKGRNI